MLQVKVFIFLLFGVVVFKPLLAQTNAVNLCGLVTDAENNQPLVGAQIWVQELEVGTITDSSGGFCIKNIPVGNYHLQITYLGFRSTNIHLHSSELNKNLDVALQPTYVELAQVEIKDQHIKHDKSRQSLSLERVDKLYLDENESNNFAETLSKMAGVSALNTGVGIAKPVVRGLSFNRVQVNDMGVKQEGQQWGADHGLEVDQYDIAGVEVIKGAASLLYGSDAIGGLINLTQVPFPLPGAVEAGGRIFYKSNNNDIGSSLFFKKGFKKSGVRCRVTYHTFGDYFVPDHEFTYQNFTYAIPNGRLPNTGGEEVQVTTEYKQHIGSSVHRVKASGYYINSGLFPGAIGVPGANVLAGYPNDRIVRLPNQEVHHYKLLTNSNIKVGAHWLELKTGIQYNLRNENSYPHTHGRPLTPEGNLAHGLRLFTAQANVRYYLLGNSFSDKMWLIGAESQLKQNKRKGFEFVLPSFDRQQHGLYLFHENKPFEKFRYNFALRTEWAFTQLKTYTDTLFYDPNRPAVDSIFWERSPEKAKTLSGISAAAGAVYNFNPNATLRLNFARTFRLPSAAELSLNGVHHGTFRHEQGNFDLNPETAFQLDIGLDVSKKQWFLALAAYYNYFENYIYLKPMAVFSTLPAAGQLYRYTQNTALHTGFEASVGWHPVEVLHLKCQAEYVYIQNLDQGLPIPFTPPMSVDTEVSFKASFFKQKTKFLANYNWFAAQNRVDRNEKPTPGYMLINLRTEQPFCLKKNKFTAWVAINNLANQSYLKHLSRYRLLNLSEQGRNVVLGLKFKL